jgi:hypothetical protein
MAYLLGILALPLVVVVSAIMTIYFAWEIWWLRWFILLCLFSFLTPIVTVLIAAPILWFRRLIKRP